MAALPFKCSGPRCSFEDSRPRKAKPSGNRSSCCLSRHHTLDKTIVCPLHCQSMWPCKIGLCSAEEPEACRHQPDTTENQVGMGGGTVPGSIWRAVCGHLLGPASLCRTPLIWEWEEIPEECANRAPVGAGNNTCLLGYINRQTPLRTLPFQCFS